jgi:hypothetical protein
VSKTFADRVPTETFSRDPEDLSARDGLWVRRLRGGSVGKGRSGKDDGIMD